MTSFTELVLSAYFFFLFHGFNIISWFYMIHNTIKEVFPWYSELIIYCYTLYPTM